MCTWGIIRGPGPMRTKQEKLEQRANSQVCPSIYMHSAGSLSPAPCGLSGECAQVFFRHCFNVDETGKCTQSLVRRSSSSWKGRRQPWCQWVSEQEALTWVALPRRIWNLSLTPLCAADEWVVVCFRPGCTYQSDLTLKEVCTICLIICTSKLAEQTSFM